MKKFCFSTLGCLELTLEEIVALAKKYNLSAIEIRGIADEMDNTKIECFLPENAENTKKFLKDNGIEIIGMGTSACCDAIGFKDEEIEKLYREIDVASRMGIPNIRVFGNNVKEEYENVLKAVLDALTKACDYASDKNVNILLEIHGDFKTVEYVMPVVNAMKEYKNFGILWDVAHSDVAYKENWMEFYKEIKPYVRHVHVKDHIRAPFKIVTPGEGEIPFVDICATLEKDGYDGYYSLEWERKWHPHLDEITVALDALLGILNGG